MTYQSITRAVLLCLGLAINSAASAALLANGNYHLLIQPTPTLVIPGIPNPVNDYGNQTDGWNSSFTFGGIPLKGDSRGMTDNGVTINHPNAGVVGSSTAGDGYAGVLGFAVNNGNIVVTSFAVDAILATAGGNFVQYAGPNANMFGSVDDLGNMTLALEGRLGTIASFLALYNKLWNFNDANIYIDAGGTPSWTPFTTGTSQAAGNAAGGPGPITGRPLTSIGDINGDSITDYSVILVSAGNVGKDWGGFQGVPYAEVWNAHIVSAVPIPAAFWLLGAGLLGLAGVAQRRK